MNRRFEGSGEIRGVDLLAALVALWRERASVTLDFTRGGITAGLDISEGDVVSAFSADPRFETAAILVRAGKLDAAAVERLAVPEGSDPAKAAMQAGVLTRREWKWGEKIRAIEVLSDLLTWNDGRYVAEPDSRSASGEFRLPIPRLVLELFLRSRDQALVEHQLGNPDAPLLRSEDFDAQFATFGLTADAESVVRLIDGHSTAREIASKAPAEAFAVEKLLAALVTLGLLEPAEAPAEKTGSAAAAAAAAAVEQLPPADADTKMAPEDFAESASSEIDVLPEIETEASPLEIANAFETRALDAAAVRAELPSEAARSWDTLAPGTPDPILERVGDSVEEPPRRGQGPLLVGVFLVLAAAVAGVLFFRSRTGSGGGGAVPVQREQTAAALAPTEAPRPTSAPAPTPHPTANPTAVKAARPVPTLRPTIAGRKPWLDRAEAGRKRLASEPNTRYAIQLLLACEVPTLEDAFRHEQPAGSMWLLTTDHKGKTCFKVLWGRFGSVEEARKAKEIVPSHFVSSSNRPAVVGVR